MLPLPNRIKTQSDFQSVLNSGLRDYQKSITVFINHTSNLSRLGLIASRKTGNAVMRHLLARRTREIFRKFLLNHPTGLDVVVKFSTKFKNPSFEQIEKDFNLAIKKLLERKVVEN